jgi:3-oxoacyl-[acyl-carrier-protein] synthase II
MAHGTGTQQNDDAEATALMRVGCTNAYVTSIKPMTGHTLASSGLISLVVAVSCLRSGAVPANLNLKQKSVAAAGLTIPPRPVMDAAPRLAQVDAFGFGGINAVAILEKRR